MNAPQDLPQQPVPMFSPKHFPVYMDYSATTPIDPRVVDKMLPYLREQFGNAASRSHAYGWAAEEAVEWARSEIAQLVHADPREIVFTSGATESINLALKGAAHFYKDRGNHIITVKTEDDFRDAAENTFDVRRAGGGAVDADVLGRVVVGEPGAQAAERRLRERVGGGDAALARGAAVRDALADAGGRGDVPDGAAIEPSEVADRPAEAVTVTPGKPLWFTSVTLPVIAPFCTCVGLSFLQ